mmetsp:Transcript_6048/g.14026  ORF Transcript_6048/g.14026 Transcript_6048/m.14026 type:complete len:155 (-) Transcript_6048:194-658(-)
MGEGLDSEYRLRLLERDDFGKGYVQLLAQLTSADGLTEEAFQAIFDHRQALTETYRSVVIEHVPSSQVVATATLLVEKKFVHKGSSVGHIEDVVVDAGHRKKGLAKQALAFLEQEAKNLNCYKIILDCSDENVPVYEKSGYKPCQRQMRLDLPH